MVSHLPAWSMLFSTQLFQASLETLSFGKVAASVSEIHLPGNHLKASSVSPPSSHITFILERRNTVDSTASSALVSDLIISDPLLPPWFIAAPQPAGCHRLSLVSDSNRNHTYIIRLIKFSLILNYPIHHIC